MGHHQFGDFPADRNDGPNWLNDPTIALSMSMLVHIWKSLPFWTLILIAARLAIPDDLYEAASVDGATSLQKFKYVTWPSMQTIYVTCTILSMIWTLGDFNSVYLLTGRRPATSRTCSRHSASAICGSIRSTCRLAAIVVALPLVLPLVYFMMKRLSR
jgi:multiple sugar transport system permease protein